MRKSRTVVIVTTVDCLSLGRAGNFQLDKASRLLQLETLQKIKEKFYVKRLIYEKRAKLIENLD